MSINGITNPLLSSLGPMARPETTRPSGDRAGQAGLGQAGIAHTDRGTAGTAAAIAPRAPLKQQAPIVGTQTAVPAEAPAGTDPSLWSVLTSEERNFFAKSAAMGPLTYGRIKAVTHPAPPAARGVRLDVRA